MTFTSVTSILVWAGQQTARYLSTDYSLPYVLKGKLYHYFSWDEQERQYHLVMTSHRDLQEK